MSDYEALRRVAEDDVLMYEVGRRAVEDVLIDLRDGGISLIGPGNGLVVRYADGSESSAIRLRVESAVKIAMQAMADELEKRGARV